MFKSLDMFKPSDHLTINSTCYDHDKEQKQVPDHHGAQRESGGRMQESCVEERSQEKRGRREESLMPGCTSQVQDGSETRCSKGSGSMDGPVKPERSGWRRRRPIAKDAATTAMRRHRCKRRGFMHDDTEETVSRLGMEGSLRSLSTGCPGLVVR